MTNPNLTIEILYFDDCPSWKNSLEILKSVLEGLEISPEISMIKVETQAEAVEHQFTGSPTIRVDGADLFPTNQDHYALGCRVYQTPDGLRGWPTEEMVKERLLPKVIAD